MKTVNFNCRNFKCPSNVSGDCCLETVTMTPVGPHIDILCCVECPRGAEEEDVIMRKGVAVRSDDTDPSSK